jgi:hypothetical protein
MRGAIGTIDPGTIVPILQENRYYQPRYVEGSPRRSPGATTHKPAGRDAGGASDTEATDCGQLKSAWRKRRRCRSTQRVKFVSSMHTCNMSNSSLPARRSSAIASRSRPAFRRSEAARTLTAVEDDVRPDRERREVLVQVTRRRASRNPEAYAVAGQGARPRRAESGQAASRRTAGQLP